MPAQAGIQKAAQEQLVLDPRFRGGDGKEGFRDTLFRGNDVPKGQQEPSCRNASDTCDQSSGLVPPPPDIQRGGAQGPALRLLMKTAPRPTQRRLALPFFAFAMAGFLAWAFFGRLALVVRAAILATIPGGWWHTTSMLFPSESRMNAA
jgi:hypothetical protein